ncbi:MAG: serine/threonine-protein kinase [Polyangiaceae bacterium]
MKRRLRWTSIATVTSQGMPERLGPYQVLGKLAEGGMAVIYLGRRVTPGDGPSHVALKVIKEEYAKNREFVDMFVDEARIAAKLDHPSIVKLYDAGREGDRLYFAMELLTGQSLWHVWEACRERGVRLKYDLAAWIGARVAEALHHAHELKDARGVSQELVHRDVNQTNIFLTYDGHVKVIDFGLAKALGRISRTGAGIVKGKLAYMSPEQTVGKPIDRRTDVFALGATLWEVTCDRRLFRGKDDTETLKAVHEADVPDPTKIVVGYPPHLAQTLLRALERDPDKRFATAQDLARSLDASSLEGGRRLSPASLAEVMRALFERERARQAAWLAEASAPRDASGRAVPTMRPPVTGSYVSMGEAAPSTSELFSPASLSPSPPTEPPPKPPSGAAATTVVAGASRPPEPPRRAHPLLVAVVLSVVLAAVGAGLALLSR